MASNKTYTVVVGDETLGEYKTLTVAKKLADTKQAQVWCDGKVVYEATATVPSTATASIPASTLEGDADTTPEEGVDTSPAVEGDTAPKAGTAASFRLTSLMNVRDQPSLSGIILGTKPAGTIVRVVGIVKDWLHLTDGSYILYASGRYAEQV